MNDLIVGPDYATWLTDLKSRIQRARSQAALSVNQELVRLYHHIGSEILARQDRQGWGAKVIDRLAVDLRAAFPDMKGLSASNFKYMRYFAELCPGIQFGQQPADQLSWEPWEEFPNPPAMVRGRQSRPTPHAIAPEPS
jgi:hypothetical protein